MDFSNDIINEIQDRTNIVDIIRDYVPLKKRGKNYIGLCPFHTEKTPSFTVSEEKKLFKCFGCGEGGSVFQFIMKYKNLSFFEALKDLGTKVGVKVQSYSSENQEQYLFLIKVYKEAAKILNHTLTQHKLGIIGIDYLQRRSISSESIEKFQLGYSPESWTFLHAHLSKNNFSLENQVKSGLVAQKSKQSNPYDYFRHRIIFPIFDELNRIVAFGGRVLDDSNPKYLNSHENYYFKKRELVYGLNWAKDHITREGKAIIVEGYFDVIMAQQMGIENVVAPLGTGLTEKHIQKIKRYTEKIILIFDGDAAGEKAMIRGLAHALKANLDTYVVSLPEQSDPCDFLLQHSPEEFRTKIDQAKPALDFRIEWGLNQFNVENSFQKQQFLKDLFSFLNSLESEVQKEEGIKLASQLLDISEKAIQADYHKLFAKASSKSKQADIFNQPPKRIEADRLLLFTLLNNPDLFPNYINKISLNSFQEPFTVKLYQTMLKVYEEDGQIDVLQILDAYQEGKERELVFDDLFNNKYQHEPVKTIQNCLNKLKLKQLEKQRLINSKRIAEAQKQQIDVNDLLEEQQFLTKEIIKLK